jgi:hypothetical protein
MLCDDNRLLSVRGSGDAAEGKLSWSFETGAMGASMHKGKALLTASARFEMPDDCTLAIDIEYNESGEWKRAAEHKGRGAVADIRIKPRRCDTFRLRFSGEGEFALYDLAVIETECVLARGIR